MGIITIVKKVKEIHPDYVTIVRVGKFFYTYGKDSYIISYLFNYKLSMFEEISRCGFSDHSIPKVTANLEHHKISYLVLDRKNNYEVTEKVDYKNLNCYEKIFKKAKQDIVKKRRIENIISYLYARIDDNAINKILNSLEEVLNCERREV